MASVSIGNNVTTIGEYAFNRNQLTNVVIPFRVSSIRREAFQLNILTRVTFERSGIRLGTVLLNSTYDPSFVSFT
ncbi:MAG: leucine-rich repeat domain-containing protein [Treponema sp.]|nr:leucine-rich repeat domain-containing protein [Treponema sp.]